MSIPVSSITAASLPANSAGASGADNTAAMPQAQQPGAISQDGDTASTQPATQASQGQLGGKLQDALKKSGINAEIELNGNGYMVVKYVDQDTQHLLFQIPTQTVLDLVASLSQANHDNQNAGALINQLA